MNSINAKIQCDILKSDGLQLTDHSKLLKSVPKAGWITKDTRRPSLLSYLILEMVELTGIEPVTPCLQSRCSPS
jgi:hypothetical protein